jgi:Peptidase inhibitor family I36
MKQKWMRTALVSALVIGGAAGAVAPAASAASFPNCPAHLPCLYKGPGGTGTKSIQQVLGTPGPLQIVKLVHSHFIDGTVVDDQVSSVQNNTDWCLRLFRDPDFQGSEWDVPAHMPRDLGGTPFDNQASSVAMDTQHPEC